MLKQAISHTILVSFLFFHAGTFFGGNEMKEQKTDNDVGIFDILPLDMIKEVFSNLPRLVDKKNFYLCSTNCTRMFQKLFDRACEPEARLQSRWETYLFDRPFQWRILHVSALGRASE